MVLNLKELILVLFIHLFIVGYLVFQSICNYQMPTHDSGHYFSWVQLMMEKEKIMEIPAKQRMERQETLLREHSEEHKAALRRAITLAVPHAYSPSRYGTFEDNDNDKSGSVGEASEGSSKKSQRGETWDELIERLFDKDESGHMVLKKSSPPNK